MMPGYNATTPGNAIPFGGPQNFIQYYQDWSHVMGRHTLRFGGSYNYIQDNRAFGAYEEPVGAFSTSGSFNWAAMNRLMGGYWGYYNGAVNPQGSYPCAFPIVGANTGCYDASGNHVPNGEVGLPVGPPDFTRSNRYQEFALYVSDSWKATRKLTLSLGLTVRVLWHPAQRQPATWTPTITLTAAVRTNLNASPTVTFCWLRTARLANCGSQARRTLDPRLALHTTSKETARPLSVAATALLTRRNFGNVTFNVIQNPPNYEVVALTDGGNTAVGSMGVTTNPAGPLAGTSGVVGLPGASLRAVNPNINQSYAQLYSLTVERQIQPNVIFGLDFSGSRGIHLYDIANINSYGAGAIYLGNPNPLARLRTTQYSNINYRSSGGISSYNAMVARIQMNNWAKHGLTLNANYTYGHTLDELSDTFSSSINNNNLGYLDPYNPRLDYGNSLHGCQEPLQHVGRVGGSVCEGHHGLRKTDCRWMERCSVCS